MKKYILTAALTALFAMPAMAEDEEVMLVKHTDGSETAFKVESVESVSFATRRIPRDFVLTSAESTDEFVHPSIDVMFREPATTAGGAIRFGFGTVTGATTPAELKAGRYGVVLSLSPTKAVDGATVDFATETNSYSLQLISYDEEGGLLDNNSRVTGGSLTFAQNKKTGVANLKFNAEFRDGTTISVDFEGKFTTTDCLEDMIPPVVYGNEMFYYTAEGDLQYHYGIYTVEKSTPSTSPNDTRFRFYFSDGAMLGFFNYCEMQLSNGHLPAAGKTSEINLASSTGVTLSFDNLRLSATSDAWTRALDNGTLRVSLDEAGKYHFFLDVIDSYNITGQSVYGNGSKVRIILNYDEE